ncbi:(4Fe-4S)-binding protein [Smaragdicoccus niigatensis]|uniref:(4Fe-4S)-binding protein n=1 Tax=Smaragdicoccus niigatensis TaxID=359359 RepID=UPI0003690AB1|nr:(4Fe-4S)-binding protein [Smaragdicoccus niigatensis]
MAGEYSGKEYTADGITVLFDGTRCRHFAECVKGLPAVFNTKERPWIQPAEGDPQAVAEVVERCPSGALRYVLASGQSEVPPVPTSITAVPGGPLLIRGDLLLTLTGSDAPSHEIRMAACTCGSSANTPFCDGACTRH